MTEFGVATTLDVEVPDTELRQARREIEESIGDVSVTVDSDMGGTGAAPGPSTLADGGQDLGSLLVEQTDVLEDIHDLLERQGGAGGGGGGGGLLGGLGIASLLSRAGGAVGGAGLGALLGGGLLAGLGVGGLFALAGSDIGLPEESQVETAAPEGSPGANIERRFERFRENLGLPESPPGSDILQTPFGALPRPEDTRPQLPGDDPIGGVPERPARDRTDGVVDRTGTDAALQEQSDQLRGGIEHQGGDARLENAARQRQQAGGGGGGGMLARMDTGVRAPSQVTPNVSSRADDTRRRSGQGVDMTITDQRTINVEQNGLSESEIRRIIDKKTRQQHEELRREIERSAGTGVR